MRKPSVVVASSFALGLVSGCMSHMPQTAAEFRSMVQGGAFMTRVTSFEANRPYEQVAEAFQRKAPCFSVRVETESATRTSYQYIVAAYKPTVTVGPAHAELDVQEKHERGVVTVYQEPPDGHYYLVADATRVNSGVTRVDIYSPSGGASDVMIAAIRDWANGQTNGCPDLAKQ